MLDSRWFSRWMNIMVNKLVNKFKKAYPNIFYTVSKQSFVSWSHYRLLLAIDDLAARQWYESEAIRCAWSVRTLQRNIEAQHYYRIIASQIKEPVEKEMKAKTAEFQMDRLEHVKNPVMLELLGVSPDASGFSVSNLRYMEWLYRRYCGFLSSGQGDFEFSEIAQQVAVELFSGPWGHHMAILGKAKSAEESLLYVHEAYANGWSRGVLLNFLKSGLYFRQGKATTNL